MKKLIRISHNVDKKVWIGFLLFSCMLWGAGVALAWKPSPEGVAQWQKQLAETQSDPLGRTVKPDLIVRYGTPSSSYSPTAALFTPDSTSILTICHDLNGQSILHRIEIPSGKVLDSIQMNSQRSRLLHLSADGKKILTNESDQYNLTPLVYEKHIKGKDVPAAVLADSPHTPYFATKTKTACQVYQTKSGKRVGQLERNFSYTGQARYLADQKSIVINMRQYKQAALIWPFLKKDSTPTSVPFPKQLVRADRSSPRMISSLPSRPIEGRKSKTAQERVDELGDYVVPQASVLSPDGRLMAVRLENARIAIWEIQTGNIISLLPPQGPVGLAVTRFGGWGDVAPFVFSPCGTYLAEIHHPQQSLILWRVKQDTKKPATPPRTVRIDGLDGPPSWGKSINGWRTRVLVRPVLANAQRPELHFENPWIHGGHRADRLIKKEGYYWAVYVEIQNTSNTISFTLPTTKKPKASQD